MLHTIIMELGHSYNYIEIGCFIGYKFLWDDDDDNTVEKSLKKINTPASKISSTFYSN